MNTVLKWSVVGDRFFFKCSELQLTFKMFLFTTSNGYFTEISLQIYLNSSSSIFYDSLNTLAYSYRADSATFLTPLLALSFMVYLVGFTGIVLGFKNFFLTMLSTELMYSGAIFAFFLLGTAGYNEFSVCGLLLLVIAASESAIGLSILIVLYRFGNSIKISDYQELRSSFVEPQKFSAFLVLASSLD